MSRDIIPGIYLIRNKLNSKVYIGESKDILRRFRQYQWAVVSAADYAEIHRSIIQDMRKFGLDNFEFKILQSGSEYDDPDQRLLEEKVYIAAYRSDNPLYGYNETPGGDRGAISPRKQSFRERLNRAIPVFLYNIETESVLLYLFGARAVADDFGCDKAITSHAMNRCDVFARKYFIFPARYSERHTIYDKKLEDLNHVKCHPKYPNRTMILVANKRKRLIRAMSYIDKVAPEFGYTN